MTLFSFSSGFCISKAWAATLTNLMAKLLGLSAEGLILMGPADDIAS
jgi:hypothetical protein